MNSTRCIRLGAALAAWGLGFLPGCGGDAPPSSPPPAGSPGGDASTQSPCSSPGETYSVGMTKSSTRGALTVELADALPAPPGYGANKWTLRITGADQNPIAGAFVNVGLKMPEHADHVLPGTTGTELGGGTYEVTDLNLIMAGLYNITVEITPSGGQSDSVRFQFCVRRQGD